MDITGEELEKISQIVDESTDRIYEALESLCICFPARLSGSEILEKALDYLYEYGKLHVPPEHCHEEPVDGVPHWVRGDWGEEYCTIAVSPSESSWPHPYPLERTIQVLANGMSVGTAKEGLTAEIAIVTNWQELDQLGSVHKLQGKIVLYDYKHFTSYGDVASFRYNGWYRASQYGAVAVLVRSLTPDQSTSGHHTGTQRAPTSTSDSPTTKPIPGACISIEDAEMLSRLMSRGHRLTATLHLPCQLLPPVQTRNLSFEMKGTEFPNKIIILGAHADSWDCVKRGCQGAHDDGQGVVILIEILRILYEKNWRPKRTIRMVVYTDEEVMSTGGIAYAKQHAHEASNILVAIETDLGVGQVGGFGCSASDSMKAFFRDTLVTPLRNLLGDEDIDMKEDWTGRGVDIGPLQDEHNTPLLLLRHKDAWWTREYFHYHHTNSDTIDKIDKKRLGENAKTLLLTVWLLANASDFPRKT